MLDVPKIDIRPDHLEIVQGILKKYVPLCEVWAFGSRAKWTAKEYSDLDLAIITDRPLSLDVSASLSDDFSESDLPWRVDVVDWATTSESFRKVIERDKIVVQEGKQSTGMANEWSTAPLGELCLKITDGAHSSPPSVQFGKKMASVKDLTQFGVDLKDARNISKADFDFLVKQGCQPQVGDVLIAKDGNSALDTTCLVKKPLDAVLLSSVAILRPNPEKLFPEFLKQHLSSPRTIEYLKSEFISGAAIPRVILKDFKRAIINVPPLKEQRTIAHILGTLDDKIELNRKQNETLEAMARALFKAWFVDFEPVRAKMEGRWVRGQSLPGLPAHLFDLFPDKLVESELGEIPEGWRSYAFDDVAQQGKGTVNPGNSIQDAFTHYSLPAFDSAQTPIIELGETIKSNKTPVPDGAVLVSKLNPHIPRIWLVGKAGKNAVCSTEFIVWTPKEPANSAFLYCLASSPEFNSAMRQLVTGTSNSHQRVKPEQLGEIRVIAGCAQVIEEFSKAMQLQIEQILQHRQQSRILAQLRDTLLPKLISGELRVPSVMIEGIT